MNNTLTTLQAFNAMRLYLEKYYEETASAEELLTQQPGIAGLKVLKKSNNRFKDPIILRDWMISVQKSIELGEHKKLLTLNKI